MAKQRSTRDIPKNPREPGPRMRVKPTPPETMTVEEAARRLGISKSSAYEALKRAEVPGLHIGGRWVVPRARFERFLRGDEPDAAA